MPLTNPLGCALRRLLRSPRPTYRVEKYRVGEDYLDYRWIEMCFLSVRPRPSPSALVHSSFFPNPGAELQREGTTLSHKSSL
jgi:hypothetical protein